MKKQKLNFGMNGTKMFLTATFFVMVAFMGKTMAQTYDPAAIAVINKMIDSNGLDAYFVKDDPAGWEAADFVVWSSGNPKQLLSIDCYKSGVNSEYDGNSPLYGAVSFAGLNSLESLDIGGNEFTSLDVTGCTNLEDLWCESNKLTALNVSGCISLEELDCSENKLTALDVSNLTNLEYLYCEENQLTTLNLSGCISLEDLYCYDNNLVILDVSNLTNLEYLDCSDNKLTSLNLNNCTSLYFLNCYHNELTTLDVSNFTNLEDLYCGENKLYELNLTDCVNLLFFDGEDQEVEFTLSADQAYGNYNHTVALNNPYFKDCISGVPSTVISYSSGKIISTDKTATSVCFSVGTIGYGDNLTGTINFKYEGSVGIAETDNDPSLRVYPNPAKGQLTIENGHSIPDIRLFDIVGRELQSAPFNSPEGGKLPSFGGAGGGLIVLDISHLSSGMYFLKIDGKVVKIIKE